MKVSSLEDCASFGLPKVMRRLEQKERDYQLKRLEKATRVVSLCVIRTKLSRFSDWLVC